MDLEEKRAASPSLTSQEIPQFVGGIDDPQRTIRVALDGLKAEDLAQRRAALDMIKAMGADALAGLLVVLHTRDLHTREAAAWALGELGDPRAVPDLLRHLHHEQSAEVRDAIAWALEMIGDARAIPDLIDVLAHDSTSIVRDSCAEALGALGGKEAVPGLLEALDHPDAEVRQAAIWALGNLCSCDIRAIPALTRSLSDTDPGVCWVAAWGLREHPDVLRLRASDATVKALIKSLEHAYFPPWAPGIAISRLACEALTAIGTPRALRAVEQWRHSKHP